jgi:hypothetical protein
LRDRTGAAKKGCFLCGTDLDGSLSTEVAVLSQGKKEDYDDIVTMGLALSNDGRPVPSRAGSLCGLIPKGAKNIPAAKGQGLP